MSSMMLGERKIWKTVWKAVKVEGPVLDQLEELIRSERDELGLPLYRCRSQAATIALREFIPRHRAKGPGGGRSPR